MIKNQLYPYIEQYINSFLYGFTKEQLDVGIMKGEIKFENLNLRPDGVNEVLDKDNMPFWLKAGLISKISFGCSLMNFIGEKPIEANFEGVNVILTPSYKWIIQNMDNYLFEDLKEMKMEYSAVDNNSINIFGKKINVLDNTIFRKEKIEEFFKDKTKVSFLLNKMLIDCFQFYYSKNYALILKVKHLHIRFEDDELINFIGNIAFGIKIDSFELTLSSEGSMKKNNCKISKLDFYWENNAHILIPNNILYDSIKNGSLSDSYYKNLRKIKFQNFTYKKDSKFIIQNFNCFFNFGTRAITQGKIDIFAKKENNYKLYIQFASNEMKINFFPDLILIKKNFDKFMKDFTIISQAQEFKPMKKPYNKINKNFIGIISHINKNKNSNLAKKFPFKRKMIVRDWLFYFYWCYKCKSSIYNYNLNPLRAEFSRFFNLCYKNDLERINDLNENNTEEEIKPTFKEENIWNKEKPNPDKIILSLNVDIKIKSIQLNLFQSVYTRHISNINNEFISIKILSPELKLFLSQEKFEFNLSVKMISLSPNKLKSAEKMIITNNTIKKQELNNTTENNNRQRNKNDNLLNNYSNYLTANDIDSNTGITGFMKKYNPNYSKQLKVIDKAMERINTQQSHNNSRSEIPTENNESNANNDKENIKININSNNNRERNFTNFSKNIMDTYEAIPSLQKMELNRQKNEFKISQAINHYNSNKSQSKSNNQNNLNHNKESHLKSIPKPNNINTTRNPNTKIISTGKILPLNLLEIIPYNYDMENNNFNDKNDNSSCLSIKYTKFNNNISVDVLKILFGIIRINLFSDYIIKCANILNDYEMNKSAIKSNKRQLFFLENDLKLDKNVYFMKKYILQKVEQMPNVKNNIHMTNYINYLKNEIEKGKLIYQSDSSELNYIFSYFSKGIEINFDFDNLEVVYYSHKNNKYCGKAIIPSPQFNFKINHSNISFKLYDFELDFNDLENANILFKTLHEICEDKLKYTKILIEPCMQKIKLDMEIQEKEKEKDDILSTDEHINETDEFERNLNKILNNNQKQKINKNNPNYTKAKINTEKIISENIKKNNNKEKENKILNKNKNSEKELISKIPKDITDINKETNKKEIINENRLLNLNINKNKDTQDSDNPNNIIIPKENKMIPYDSIKGDKKNKLTHKKNKSREKRQSNVSLKSKTIESLNKTNQNLSTNININNASIKEEKEKENKKLRPSKKDSSNKFESEKKGKENIKSSRVLAPNKKKGGQNVKKVPLKNIEKKQNKSNRTLNNNTDNKI